MYACACSVVSQCWVMAGLARQIETGFWGPAGGVKEGMNWACSINYRKGIRFFLTGLIQEPQWRNISWCQVLTPLLTYLSPDVFDDTNEKIWMYNFSSPMPSFKERDKEIKRHVAPWLAQQQWTPHSIEWAAVIRLYNARWCLENTLRVRHLQKQYPGRK